MNHKFFAPTKKIVQNNMSVAHTKPSSIYRLSTITLLSLSIFITLAIAVKTNWPSLIAFDERVDSLVKLTQTKWLTEFMVAVAKIDTYDFIFFLLLLSIIFLSLKKVYTAHTIFISNILAFFAVLFFKDFTERLRPPLSFIIELDYSFPSGHATFVTIAVLATIFGFLKILKSTASKEVLVASSILVALVVCVSRIYLGVHWASDVLAGVMLGIISYTFTILASKIFVWLYEKYKF